MSRTATRQQNPGRATDASGHAPGRPRHYIHIPKTSGERIADAVATGMGSWRFIIAQSVIVGIWVLINLLAFLGHWDPNPFILLNLLFSTQAAYASPVLLMAQNRQAQRDRKRDDIEEWKLISSCVSTSSSWSISNCWQSRVPLPLKSRQV